MIIDGKRNTSLWSVVLILSIECALSACVDSSIGNGNDDGLSSSVDSSSSSSIEFSSSSSVVVDWCCGAFIDNRDGHTYKWTRIGSQTWMAENLAYLPSVDTGGYSFTEARYFVYGYYGDTISIVSAKATSNYTTYGALYNYPAALMACPSGWHLPSDSEWQTLLDYVGGDAIAGQKLKSVEGWDPYKWASSANEDTYGFSLLPGGELYGSGYYFGGNASSLWSATANDSSEARFLQTSYDFSSIMKSSAMRLYGFSVRCIQD